MNGSLVMRDRETDSWWSIMTSDAIGGDLEGTDLVELAAGEKATWKDWHDRYPDTLVLSVDGEEHVDNNPYDNYFRSDETFRGLEVDDHRLQPKTPVYTFWLEGEPYAVPHRAFEGGRLLEIDPLDDRQLLLYRKRQGSIFESTRAYLVDQEMMAGRLIDDLLTLAESGGIEGIEPLAGFDTFWYSWVAVNQSTRLIP